MVILGRMTANASAGVSWRGIARGRLDVTRRNKSKKPSLEEALAALDDATDDPSSERAGAALREALSKSESYVAARAATIVREALLDGFDGALIDALDRFLDAGAKRDPGCRAKLAIAWAMDATDVCVHEPFVRAARCVQMEKAWGPPVDTAGPVRARALLALGRARYGDYLLLAGEALADPEAPVRAAALAGLVAHGDRGGAGLARYKIALGDDDPTVAAEAMRTLMSLAPDAGVERLGALLRHEDEATRELAAIALGDSHRADALVVLLEALGEAVRPQDRAPLFTALALHRSDRGLEALLAYVDGSRADAERALEALAMRAFEPELRRRAEAAAEAADVADLFAEAFGDR